MTDRLLEAQKHETIGLLASGLAHNINSPLAAIILTAEVAQAKFPDIVEFRDILQSAARIQEIVGSLAEKCHHEQVREAEEIDLSQLVKSELDFLQANLFLKHQVEIELHLQPHMPALRGLYSDLSCCFSSLVQNALEAMQDARKPRLVVETKYLKSRKSVLLSVKDTGCGIARENLKRIFEPFFTTKSGLYADADQYRPEPLGLGLATVQQIIVKYGGTIEFQSRVGRGSEFKMVIPLEK